MATWNGELNSPIIRWPLFFHLIVSCVSTFLFLLSPLVLLIERERRWRHQDNASARYMIKRNRANDIINQIFFYFFIKKHKFHMPFPGRLILFFFIREKKKTKLKSIWLYNIKLQCYCVWKEVHVCVTPPKLILLLLAPSAPVDPCPSKAMSDQSVIGRSQPSLYYNIIKAPPARPINSLLILLLHLPISRSISYDIYQSHLFFIHTIQ